MVVVLRLTFAPHIFNQNIILNFASKKNSPPTPSPRARVKRTLRRTQRQTGSAPRRLDRLWSTSGPACGQPLWVLVWPTCGTSFGTLLGPVLAHFGDQFWPTFGSSFGSLLGPVLAHFWGQFWPTLGASFGPLLGRFWFTFGTGFGSATRPVWFNLLNRFGSPYSEGLVGPRLAKKPYKNNTKRSPTDGQAWAQRGPYPATEGEQTRPLK